MIDEPETLATELLQCLIQDKKPLGILLGAGCPYSIKDSSDKPLIPDILGLTEAVKLKISSDDCADSWLNICQQLNDDFGSSPNIEEILSRVRGLRDLAGIGQVRGLDKTKLENLETKMCEEIKSCADKPLADKSTPYHNLATWIGAIDRSDPVEIFTPNYDLLVEQAFEDLRLPYFDGFVGSHQPFFDPYAVEFDRLPSRWARLWKIHGSINWRSCISEGGLKVWRSSVAEGGDVVIHPSHLKYEQSRKMPYLALMDRLRRFLSTPSAALVIIGYSFRDQHLNDVILQSLQGTPSAAAFALMFGPLSSSETGINIAKHRANISLIAEDGAIIGTKQTIWKEVDEKPETSFPGIIEWTSGAGTGNSNKVRCNLGDFRSFGLFLQGISGTKVPRRKVNE
jgi:hypothetical protein